MVAIIAGVLEVMLTASLLQGQDATYSTQKPSPPKIAPQIVVVAESVVRTQWSHTLKLVNAPQNVTLLNPGQCIRIGIYATGDKRDDYIEKTKLSFHAEFAGRADGHPLAPLSEFKQIKPKGGDFVTSALGAAGIKAPETIKTVASLGVSADHWCIPADAGGGTAILTAEIDSPAGHQALSSSTIQIESFETGSKKSFRNLEDVSSFSQTYYRQPNPARLLPALQALVAEQTQQARKGQVEIFSAFLGAALKADPIAAQDFKTRIAAQPPVTRALGLMILRSAGYDITPVPNALSAEEQQKFLNLPPLQDAYDLTPTQDLFTHLDMLWAEFEATGEFKPVHTVTGALSWRSDYDDFDKMRKSPNHPSTLTPSIVRGVTYTAAGWSLGSFQRNDPLVADYIEYMLASSDTPASVKSEIARLSSNPAFKRAGGQ